jgi:hypothetical protein
MFNALNALSEDNSLLTVPPTRNPWLLAAMAVSFGLHFLIVYVPPLASVFSIVPLTLREWGLVALFSLPVVLIDEALKRRRQRRTAAKRRASLGEGGAPRGRTTEAAPPLLRPRPAALPRGARGAPASPRRERRKMIERERNERERREREFCFFGLIFS